jgi:hypothetical protein
MDFESALQQQELVQQQLLQQARALPPKALSSVSAASSALTASTAAGSQQQQQQDSKQAMRDVATRREQNHMWRQFDQFRTEVERSELAAEYKSQSDATPRDFGGGAGGGDGGAPMVADIVQRVPLLESADDGSLLSQFWLGKKRRKVDFD